MYIYTLLNTTALDNPYYAFYVLIIVKVKILFKNGCSFIDSAFMACCNFRHFMSSNSELCFHGNSLIVYFEHSIDKTKIKHSII